jgi:hypothetical protein
LLNKTFVIEAFNGTTRVVNQNVLYLLWRAAPEQYSEIHTVGFDLGDRNLTGWHHVAVAVNGDSMLAKWSWDGEEESEASLTHVNVSNHVTFPGTCSSAAPLDIGSNASKLDLEDDTDYQRTYPWLQSKLGMLRWYERIISPREVRRMASSLPPEFLWANFVNVSEMLIMAPDGAGCDSFTEEAECLAHKDGRTAQEFEDMGVNGAVGHSPCRWCCGEACTTDTSSMCEPEEWLLQQPSYVGTSQNGLSDGDCPEPDRELGGGRDIGIELGGGAVLASQVMRARGKLEKSPLEGLL